MNELTKEWVEKAEGDFNTALREYRARKAPNYDAACFHAQQCIEKYMKARLQHAGIPFGKTHDLIALLELCIPIEPLWEAFRTSLIILNRYAVDFRYPGESATREEAKEAVSIMRSLHESMRKALGI
ncbi:MAG: HEPN domain-containing protein [Deltaproteobacteria bacterium]|nr:HEPN domain-containing protein [Deltaproteobacteria bacterium]